MRRILKKSPDPQEYERKVKELTDLLVLESKGYLKVYFADASGFSLTPNVPYGWQPSGRYTGIPSEKGVQINVFGFLSRDNTLESWYSTGSVNSALIIKYIDDFADKMTERSVIVIDNAPIHHSNAFKEKIKEWEEMDLYIFYLPKYSPHLNIIEILWRKMKYEWLKPRDYTDEETLTKAIVRILRDFGEDFFINFDMSKVSIV